MSNLVFEKLTQYFNSNQKAQFNIAGNTLRLSVTDNGITISLLKNNSVIGTMKGMLAGDYVDGIDFDGFIIENGSIGQIVSIQIAGGGAGSNRVLGEVSVINGEIQRVKSGSCFFASDNIAGAAGQYTHSQLYNPPANTKNIVLTKVIVSGVAGIYAASLYAAPLSPTISGSIGNKLTNSALLSSAELRKANDPSGLGNGFQFTSIAVANDIKEILFNEPVVIEPNTGFIIRNNTLAAPLLVNYQYYEEPI